MTVKPERLSKLIARAGVCSRRQAEHIIRAERVRVGGRLISDVAVNACRDDDITVDGKRLVFMPTTLWRFHKPAGAVTTRRDERGRMRVFDCPQVKALEDKHGIELITVGRLDLNSEGLLLLTNDGALARFLERSDLLRRYRVRVFGELSDKRLAAVRAGKAVIDGIRYREAAIAGDGKNRGKNQWLTVELIEGKNREVRKLINHCGGEVNRLIRVSFGSFMLDDLPQGTVTPVPQERLHRQAADFFAEQS